jgi:hypothetical protein
MKLYLKLPVPVAQVEYGERSGKRPDDSQCSMWENKGSVTYHLLFQFQHGCSNANLEEIYHYPNFNDKKE